MLCCICYDSCWSKNVAKLIAVWQCLGGSMLKDQVSAWARMMPSVVYVFCCHIFMLPYNAAPVLSHSSHSTSTKGESSVDEGRVKQGSWQPGDRPMHNAKTHDNAQRGREHRPGNYCQHVLLLFAGPQRLHACYAAHAPKQGSAQRLRC